MKKITFSTLVISGILGSLVTLNSLASHTSNQESNDLLAYASPSETPAPQSENKKPPISVCSSGKINDYPYVDLGLSVKWAIFNVGAPRPWSNSSFYGWGMDYTAKSVYDFNSHWGKWLGNISGSDYDVARTTWGSPWRMPTKEEAQELIDKCRWEWTQLAEKNGYKVIGPNGRWIFLPAAGYLNEYCHWVKGGKEGKGGDWGLYWLADQYSDGAAFALAFDNPVAYAGQNTLKISIEPITEAQFSVRPVADY